MVAFFIALVYSIELVKRTQDHELVERAWC